MHHDATPESELNAELFRVVRQWHLLRERFVDVLPAGLDPAAAQLLASLVKHGPARQNELAGHSYFDPSTVSRRVGQLVQHGLAERQADPVDGRAVRLAATPAGQALFARMRAARDDLTRAVLAGWTPQDVAALTALVHRFNDAMDDYRRQS